MSAPRRQIDLKMTANDFVFTMTEGDIGAGNVIVEILKLGPQEAQELLLALDDMNIRGAQIWAAYCSYAGRDLQRLVNAIDQRDPLLVEAVNLECSECREIAVTRGARFSR